MTPQRDPAPSEDGAFTSRVESRGSRHILHLSGPFHAGWLGRLAGGLATREVSVVSAKAQRGRYQQWTAELEVELLDEKLDLSTVDCLALINDRSAPSNPPGDLPITSYRVAPKPGALEVEVHAPDAVGQLDRLLRTFAFFGLFPCALQSATRGAEMEGVFQLQALGQTEPGLQVIDGLERRLASLASGGHLAPRAQRIHPAANRRRA